MTAGTITPVTAGEADVEPPDGWSWELLTDVAELATGHTPDRKRPEYWNGDIPWVNLTEIRRLDGQVADGTDLTVSPEGIRHSSAVVLPAGTVCFSRTASIGFVTIMGRAMSTSQDFVNWICGDRLDPRYLMRALLASRRRLRALSSGSTHKTIYVRVAERFRILLPPIEVQRRIATLLDKADILRARRRESVALVDALSESIFLDTFGDPVSNPLGWDTAPLADVVSGKYGLKAGPFGSALLKSDYTTSGYRVYGQEQVIAGRFDVGDYYIDESKYQSLSSCAVSAGDVLVSLVGSYGQVVVVPSSAEPGIINPRLVKITPDPSLLRSEFLAAVLKSGSTQAELRRNAHGQTMGVLNAGLLKTVLTMVPPLATQDEFLAAVSDLEQLRSGLQRSLCELNELFASLQQRAFRGDL